MPSSQMAQNRVPTIFTLVLSLGIAVSVALVASERPAIFRSTVVLGLFVIHYLLYRLVLAVERLADES